ncbi:MAG TPA: poly-beta-1,6-N-acetyl-D-glucosamine N-deacetylase PgaB [Chthoniobacter sp.]|nr:poly-beta-1,6-N-acetyl-D-glucosamine N-deacetylase PgaB [Chthoniobacter sp.]
MLRRTLLFLFVLFALALTPARAADQFAIVSFHDIVDFKGDLDEEAVTVDRLVGFFEWLRANHWTTISLDDVDAARRGKKPLPEHSVLITFDDGYRSFYTRLFPLVLAYRIPVVIAVVGSWLEIPAGGKVNYGKLQVPREHFLSWDEIREMAGSGLVEFASHSYDLHHGVLANPQGNELPAGNARIYTPGRGYETESQFRRRIADDLTRSRDALASRLGRAPRAIAWPYGRYNAAGLDEARKAGFEFALTLFPEPANIHEPMELSRYLPTHDPNLTTMVSNIQFHEALPNARRLVGLNPATLWTGDDAGTNERLGQAIERLRTLGATAVVLDAAVIGADGRIEATWFPNRELPMRADILSRLSWQIQSRARVIVDLRLPSSAALATLGSPAKVRALFDDLGAQVSAGGLFIDDAPELALIPSKNSGTPWEVRAARDTVRGKDLAPSAALALSAFKAVESYRPWLRLILVGPEAPSTGPSGLADFTLVPIAPNARAVDRLSERLRGLGWLAPSFARRGGLWFVGTQPPRERDLNSATRLFQRRGGSVIGWAMDDPVGDRPRAKAVESTVSASSFPVKF